MDLTLRSAIGDCCLFRRRVDPDLVHLGCTFDIGLALFPTPLFPPRLSFLPLIRRHFWHVTGSMCMTGFKRPYSCSGRTLPQHRLRIQLRQKSTVPHRSQAQAIATERTADRRAFHRSARLLFNVCPSCSAKHLDGNHRRYAGCRPTEPAHRGSPAQQPSSILPAGNG